MSAPEFHHERRPAWRIVRIMAAELERQSASGGPLNDDGQVDVRGTIDLAHLAHITEQAIRSEFRA